MSKRKPIMYPPNRIETIDMFNTPGSIREVEQWISAHNNKEQAHLYTASMMTWNLMAVEYNKSMKYKNDIINALLEQIAEYSSNEFIVAGEFCESLNDIAESIGKPRRYTHDEQGE